jgi:hypothetical protein
MDINPVKKDKCTFLPTSIECAEALSDGTCKGGREDCVSGIKGKPLFAGAKVPKRHKFCGI